MNVKARSLHEQEAQERLEKAFGSGDLCMLLVPKEAYAKLSDAAKERGLTVAELIAAAIDSYLSGEHRPGTRVSEQMSSTSSAQRFEVGTPEKRPRKLKGFH